MLTKEQIDKLTAAADRKPMRYTCDAGVGFFLPLTCEETDHLEHLLSSGGPFTAYILCRSLCDQQGKRYYADDEQRKLAGGKPELRKIGMAILLAQRTEKDLVERLEKNSPETKSGSGG